MKQKVVLSNQNRRELKALFRPYKRPARHSGQALLLVVLIMLVAALISAGFLSIVSGNLNQTARTADRNKAQEAARAGLKYVNDQLTNSMDGEMWFAHNYQYVGTADPTTPVSTTNPAIIDTSIPGSPTPTNIDGAARSNPFYYSELDRVQGWAGKFVKFPDPNGKPVSNAPKFLARVDRIPTNLPVTNPEFTHSGQLKITVIGLTEDDPNVFYRTVSYKGGVSGAPVGQAMRTVSNWDYTNNAVPVAAIGDTTPYTAPTSSAAGKLVVKNRTASFGKAPFAVVIGKADGSTLRYALVTGVSADGNTFDIASPIVPAPTADERVEAAAPLGSPDGSKLLDDSARIRNGVDFLNDGAFGTAGVNNDVTPSFYQVARNTPSGVRINGSAIYFGATQSLNLLSSDNAYAATGNVPAKVEASGLFANGSSSAQIVPTRIEVKGTLSGTNTPMATAEIIPDSAGNLPTGTAAFPALGTGTVSDIVSDGWSRLRSEVGKSTRIVKPFTPPNFASGSGLARYRDLTQNSAPNDKALAVNLATNASSSLYGYGQGIYIDNRTDREKYAVTVSGTTTLQEMPQDVLQQMWLNAPTPGTTIIPVYGRTPAATLVATRPVTYTTSPVSLEEQHVRGWVSPNEFLPRGVLIEILANNTLRVTRDARDDNTTGTTPAVNAVGPVQSKAWVAPAGGLPEKGVYTRVFNWPANGVIFAEGNVRIVSQPRTSTAVDPPCSLTVASMNNIYIEGPLSLNRPTSPTDSTVVVRPRKLLLLARKNVVLNPTRMMGQPDVQSTVKTNAAVAVTANNPTSVPVASASGFNPGDRVRFTTGVLGSEALSTTALVTAIDTANNQLTITADTTTALVDGSNVRVPLENAYNFNTNSVDVYYSAVSQSTNVPAVSGLSGTLVNEAVTRRVQIPGVVPASLRYAFDHVGERKVGLTVGTTVTTPPGPTEVYFSNKRVMNPADEASANTATFTQAASVVSGTGDVATNNKLIRADYKNRTTDPVERKSFGSATDTVGTVATNMGTTIVPVPNAPDPDGNWKFTATPAVGFDLAPFFYLAGFGQRNYAYNSSDATPSIPATLSYTSTGTEWRKNIIGSTTYALPLATSVSMFFGGTAPGGAIVPAQQTFTTYDSAGNLYSSSYFGFNPTYLTTATAPALPEDVTTSDQSFYRPDTAIADSVFDARSISAATAGSIDSLTLQQSSGLSASVNTAANLLPQYRLRNLKLEQVAVSGTGTPTVAVAPGATINIDAYVIAQEGSWFVIPGGYFREKSLGTGATQINENLVRTVNGDINQCYYDFNNNYISDAGESIASGTGTVPDFNRNGLADPDEKLAAARYFRYNYQINFTGAIAENRSAIVESAGYLNYNIPGAVSDWTNKWASVTSNGTSAGTTPDVIKYNFDQTYALGLLTNNNANDSRVTIVNTPATGTTPAYQGDYDFGFQMPQSPDLTYTE